MLNYCLLSVMESVGKHVFFVYVGKRFFTAFKMTDTIINNADDLLGIKN